MRRRSTRALCWRGASFPSELYYQDDLRPRATLYLPCITGTRERSTGSFTGRVTDYLAHHFPVGTYDFYLCGRREMIRDVTLLVDDKFPGSTILSERFF